MSQSIRAPDETVVTAGAIKRIAASLTDQHVVIAVASPDVVALATDDIFYGRDRVISGLAVASSTARQGTGRGRWDSLLAPQAFLATVCALTRLRGFARYDLPKPA